MRGLQLIWAAFGVAVGCCSLGSMALALGEGAKAEIKLSGGEAIGSVTFVEGTGGVLLKFDLKGLPPGPHGVSIHDVGTCDGDLTRAGGVFNPLGAKHGFLNDEGPMAGDLPNIHASTDGSVVSEMMSPFLSLSKDAEETLFDADGASIVISEKADDYLSEPDGNAGRPIACGVIELAK